MESSCAYLLDCVGWKWSYEPFSILLGGIPYTPDFYVPEKRYLIECRGYRTASSALQIERMGDLVREGKLDLPDTPVGVFVCIGPDETIGFKLGCDKAEAGMMTCLYCGFSIRLGRTLEERCPCSQCGAPWETVMPIQIQDGIISVGGCPSRDFSRLRDMRLMVEKFKLQRIGRHG